MGQEYRSVSVRAAGLRVGLKLNGSNRGIDIGSLNLKKVAID